MSFTERRAAANKHPWTLPQLAEADELIRPITHAPPGNFSKPTAKTMGKVELAKRKNDYFEGAFSVRGDRNPVRERIRSDSIVVVELRTNVIVSSLPHHQRRTTLLSLFYSRLSHLVVGISLT